MTERTRYDMLADGTIVSPVNDQLGIELAGRDGDEVTLTWTVSEEYCNTTGGAQGGVLAAFADAVLGAACGTRLPGDKYPALAEMKISVLRPVPAGEHLTGTGRVLKAGRRVLFVEARITNSSGDLVATASGTEIPADVP